VGQRHVVIVLPAVNMGDSVRVLRTAVTSHRASPEAIEVPMGNTSARAIRESYNLMESGRGGHAGDWHENTKCWWQWKKAVMQIRVDVDDGRPRILIARFPAALLKSEDDRESLANAIAACISITSVPLGRAGLVAAIDFFARKIAPDSGPELGGRE